MIATRAAVQTRNLLICLRGTPALPWRNAFPAVIARSVSDEAIPPLIRETFTTSLRFVNSRIPNEYDRVRAMFRRLGAYRRFKDFLHKNDPLEAWYEFEGQCEEKALREWCRENGIESSD